MTFFLAIIFPAPHQKRKRKKKVHSQSSDYKYSCFSELVSLCELHLLSGSLGLPVLILRKEVRLRLPYSATHFPRFGLHLGGQVMGRLEREVRRRASCPLNTPGAPASQVCEGRSLSQSSGPCGLPLPSLLPACHSWWPGEWTEEWSVLPLSAIKSSLSSSFLRQNWRTASMTLPAHWCPLPGFRQPWVQAREIPEGKM